MKKTYFLALSIILAGCANTPKIGPIDQKMYQLNKSAIESQRSGDLKASVEYFKQCIALKPQKTAIETSRPRRWCQNNLVGLLACNNSATCDPELALTLGKELIDNHYDGKKTLYYDPVYLWSLATAYAANGDYVNAVKTQEHAIERIVKDSPRLPKMRQDLMDYKVKQEGSQP